jgi:hypothetical protein
VSAHRYTYHQPINHKLSNDRINSLVGLTYHHFIIHGIVVIVVMLGIVVLIPPNLIDNSDACINVRDTSKKPRTIMTRILHRCSSVQALFGFLLRMMVQADFRWWIATTIHHEVLPDGSGEESVEVEPPVCSIVMLFVAVALATASSHVTGA